LAGCDSDSNTGSTSTAPSDAAKPVVMSPTAQTNGPLPAGVQAPDFEATDQSGNRIQLRELLKDQAVVLVFYPGDDTPGCTKQLCAVRDDWSQFQAANATVLGVNPADQESHTAFREKYSFPFPLIVDTDATIAEAYGTDGMLMVKRTVFVINQDGEIVLAERGMVGHDKIFEALKGTS
jgi:peroxiredoxin Q/BCP